MSGPGLGMDFAWTVSYLLKLSQAARCAISAFTPYTDAHASFRLVSNLADRFFHRCKRFLRDPRFVFRRIWIVECFPICVARRCQYNAVSCAAIRLKTDSPPRLWRNRLNELPSKHLDKGIQLHYQLFSDAFASVPPSRE